MGESRAMTGALRSVVPAGFSTSPSPSPPAGGHSCGTSSRSASQTRRPFRAADQRSLPMTPSPRPNRYGPADRPAPYLRPEGPILPRLLAVDHMPVHLPDRRRHAVPHALLQRLPAHRDGVHPEREIAAHDSHARLGLGGVGGEL